MPQSNPIVSLKFYSSYGTHLLYHLPINRAGLAAGQVAVAAVARVNPTSCQISILKRFIASRASGMLIWLFLLLLILFLSFFQFRKARCFPVWRTSFFFPYP